MRSLESLQADFAEKVALVEELSKNNASLQGLVSPALVEADEKEDKELGAQQQARPETDVSLSSVEANVKAKVRARARAKAKAKANARMRRPMRTSSPVRRPRTAPATTQRSALSASLEASRQSWTSRQRDARRQEKQNQDSAELIAEERRKRLQKASKAKLNAAMERMMKRDEERRQQREAEEYERLRKEEDLMRSMQFKAKEIVLSRGEDWKTRQEKMEVQRKQRIHAQAMRLSRMASLPPRMKMHAATMEQRAIAQASAAEDEAPLAWATLGSPPRDAALREREEEPEELTARLKRQQDRWQAQLNAKKAALRKKNATKPREQPIERRQKAYEEKRRRKEQERQDREEARQRQESLLEKRKRERLMKVAIPSMPKTTYSSTLKATVRRQELQQEEHDKLKAEVEEKRRSRRLREVGRLLKTALDEQERERKELCGGFKTEMDVQREIEAQRMQAKYRKQQLEDRLRDVKEKRHVGSLVDLQTEIEQRRLTKVRALTTVARTVGEAMGAPDDFLDAEQDREWVRRAQLDEIFDDEEKIQLGLTV
eukprot:scaffold4562_cov255-Pinguiococcus_pyrenoidosus.AAC.12